MPESFGRYRLVERLGSGGMAHVFRAVVDGEFQRPLVIKRILPELSDHPDFVRLLQDEARLSARLDHRAIVRVYELGQVGNEHFLAMEFIDGPDLASLLASRGKMDPSLACYLIHEVASALSYAHSLEI